MAENIGLIPSMPIDTYIVSRATVQYTDSVDSWPNTSNGINYLYEVVFPTTHVITQRCYAFWADPVFSPNSVDEYIFYNKEWRGATGLWCRIAPNGTSGNAVIAGIRHDDRAYAAEFVSSIGNAKEVVISETSLTIRFYEVRTGSTAGGIDHPYVGEWILIYQ